MIERRECYELSTLKGWSLIYGRRKVGKTYLATRCVPHDSYYVVTRQMDVLNGGERLELGKAVTQIARELKAGKSVIFDEFQRVPEALWEVLTTQHPSGKLTLLASSLGITKKAFDRNSPLLGLALPYRMDVVHYPDALAHFGDPLSALLFRDPWVTAHASSWADVSRNPQGFYYVVKGLIGEVFQEEERRFTQIYEAILISVAEGEWNSSIITSRLQSTLSVNGSTVSSYLDSLGKMGLIRKIKVFRGGRGAEWYHTLSSPLMSAVLYAEAKHRVSDNNQEVDLTRPIARELQFSVGELLAEKNGAQPAYSPKVDIDIVLLKHGKPIAGYEVKIGEIEKAEAEKATWKIRSAGIPRAGLVSLTAKPPPSDESLTTEDLVKIAREIRKKWQKRS